MFITLKGYVSQNLTRVQGCEEYNIDLTLKTLFVRLWQAVGPLITTRDSKMLSQYYTRGVTNYVYYTEGLCMNFLRPGGDATWRWR